MPERSRASRRTPRRRRASTRCPRSSASRYVSGSPTSPPSGSPSAWLLPHRPRRHWRRKHCGTVPPLLPIAHGWIHGSPACRRFSGRRRWPLPPRHSYSSSLWHSQVLPSARYYCPAACSGLVAAIAISRGSYGGLLRILHLTHGHSFFGGLGPLSVGPHLLGCRFGRDLPETVDAFGSHACPPATRRSRLTHPGGALSNKGKMHLSPHGM